eukprot:CAMPEP_0117580958 /NCGR_PEP_ID=MMETSP0784-20121206/65526_1 /TAXON_ID=39447 /ORGANISM="" /LENGTH=48 /DNA_ID= /DNA_START= /DNA_END= /DNA_ORIENTATION=
MTDGQRRHGKKMKAVYTAVARRTAFSAARERAMRNVVQSPWSGGGGKR